MPPMIDLSVMHCEMAGDIYLHLQDNVSNIQTPPDIRDAAELLQILQSYFRYCRVTSDSEKLLQILKSHFRFCRPFQMIISPD